MASSNGRPELLGSIDTAQLNQGRKHTKDLTTVTAKTSRLREKRRHAQWLNKVVFLHNEQHHQLLSPVNTFRHLADIEMELVHGDEQKITDKSPASTSSHLTCHSSETTVPPSGPNLASLPPIDKRLDAALQDAERYYRLKNYTAAAIRFTVALQVLPLHDIYISIISGPYTTRIY